MLHVLIWFQIHYTHIQTILGININAMYPEFLYFISYVAMGYAFCHVARHSFHIRGVIKHVSASKSIAIALAVTYYGSK